MDVLHVRKFKAGHVLLVNHRFALPSWEMELFKVLSNVMIRIPTQETGVPQLVKKKVAGTVLINLQYVLQSAQMGKSKDRKLVMMEI